MKKNNIKQSLALSLALAMTVTSVPVNVSAAKAPTLNKTSKTLYVNNNEIGTKFDFNIKNKVAGSKYSWTSSSKSIATVNSKGIVTAKKVGKATISCKITLPTKKTKTLKATVTVKENANSAKISNPVETLVAGAEYNFNKKFSTASGCASTDYQNWVIDEASNTAGATVKASNGIVKTTKVGEFKIKVQAYQNKTKLAAGQVVESEWLTVKTTLAMTDVAQKADNKIELTFNDTMNKDNFKASDITIKDSFNAIHGIKDVEFNENKVTLTLWNTLTDSKVYNVAHATFNKDITASVGAVSSVVINTTTVEKAEPQEIKYSLLDANGIDVTASKATSSNVEITAETEAGYLDGNKLVLFAKGNTAKVTVTYRTFEIDANGNETGKVSATATITAVDAEAITVGKYDKYSVATAKPDFDKDTMNNKLEVNKSGYKMFVRAYDSKNNEVKTGVGEDKSIVSKFASSDSNVLLVNEDGTLYGVKAGSVHVLAYDNNGKVMWTLPVEVVAEGKASSLTIKNNKNNITLTNADEVNDSVTITGIVKNQHNLEMEGQELVTLDSTGKKDLANQPISKPANASKVPTVSISGTEITINAKLATKGEYKYMFNVEGTNLRTVVTVNVQQPDASANSVYQLEVSETTVDTTIKADTNLDDLKVQLKVGEYKGGVLNSYKEISTSDVKEIVKTDDATATITPVEVDSKTLAINTVEASEKNITSKVAAGTYRIKVELDGKTFVKYLTVKDSQSTPEVKFDKLTSDQNTVLAAVNDCVTINKDNSLNFTKVTYKSTTSIESDQTSLSVGNHIVYLDKATVNVKVGDFTVATEVVLNKTITITVK